MTGPTFSPDGKWMWDGNAWIPAPPQANVLPQASLNQNQISTVANNAGVPVNQLSNTAPYFDQNRDGILQNTELQQAAAAIAQPPTMPVPMQSPQPPVMQQPMVQQPMIQQPMVQQPMVQQPMVQQPMMQSSKKSDSNKTIIIIASSIVLLILGAIIINWAGSVAKDESIGLDSIVLVNSLPYNVDGGIGATDGSQDLLATFDHDIDSFDLDWNNLDISVYVSGEYFVCATEKSDSATLNSADCKISWQSVIPSYSPYDPFYDGGAVDVTETNAAIGRCDGDPFCGVSISLMENGRDIINSNNYDSVSIQLEISYDGGNSLESNMVFFSVGLLDHDGDGVDDFTDDCDNTPTNDEVDGVGCTLNPDQDNDGINDDEDLLVNGNAGLKIYISQLHILEGESYEQNQRWPCNDGVGSVPYSWINDGAPDCQDGSDEAIEAGEQGVHYRIPDFTYRLKVDWNCDEIYDETIDMANEGVYYQDVEYLNISLDAATQNGRVLNRDIVDDLDSVCIAINVFDVDIIGSSELESLDVTEIEGTGQSVTILIGNEAFDGDYTWTIQGANADDSVNDNADAKVSIRFLIYEV